jgi:structural maintenance of chromosome 1
LISVQNEELRERENAAAEVLAGIHEKIAELRKQDEAFEARTEELAAVHKEARRREAAVGKQLQDLLQVVGKTQSVLDQLRGRKHSLLKKCKVEGVQLPLLRGSLDAIDQDDGASAAGAAGGAPESRGTPSVESDSLASQVAQRIYAKEALLELDYTGLKVNLRALADPAEIELAHNKFLEEIDRLAQEMAAMEPNMKAGERLGGVEDRFEGSRSESLTTLRASEEAARAFQEVRQQRLEMFTNAYDHVLAEIDGVYKALTASPTYAGGTASISLENEEEPFLGGIRYHAMPPLKRFRDMEALSGGEKTVAALALLFALHSYRQAPFFVLDEIDDALDNTNVYKVARYIDQRTREAGTSFQCIVISLKGTFYENAASLVGVYREKSTNSSHVVTLDLEQVRWCFFPLRANATK